MRKLILIMSLVFTVTLSPNVVLGETVKVEDLVMRKDLYYQKSSDVPFTGNVTGREQGEIKKGKREGLWVRFYKNGQSSTKHTYKNGNKEGPWVTYHKNGQLQEKGNTKNGVKVK